MDAIRDYRPVNLPTRFETVPMPVKAVHASADDGADEGDA
jgi:hypothetical protein